jgi:hypothetical protein
MCPRRYSRSDFELSGLVLLHLPHGASTLDVTATVANRGDRPVVDDLPHLVGAPAITLLERMTAVIVTETTSVTDVIEAIDLAAQTIGKDLDF